MIGTILAAASLAAAAPADAREAYARRQYLLDADAKCRLLSDRERTALSGSAGQARGALLRAGVDPAPIASSAADRAAAVACTDEQLRLEAAGAQAAFSRWAAAAQQDFPGEHQSWRASRRGYEGGLAWTLWQDLGGGVRLGLAESADARVTALALPLEDGARQPRTALLEYRDPAKWPDFVDPTLGGLFAPAGDGALARRAAPAALSRRVWSAGPVAAEVQPPAADSEYLYWSLPPATLDELARLDPRDVARLTVEYQNNRVRMFYLEVGDLAAALGFLAAGETPFGDGQGSS